jgi:hypothetical protein
MAKDSLKISLVLLLPLLVLVALWFISTQFTFRSIDALTGCEAMGIDSNFEGENDAIGGRGALRAYFSPDETYAAVQHAGSYGHHWFYVYDCVAYRRYLFGTENGFEGGRVVFGQWISDTEFSLEVNGRHETGHVPEHSTEPYYDQIYLPPPELIEVIGESPDGEWRLIYSSAIDRLYVNILRQSLADESIVENVTRSIGTNTFIEWSPDGTAFLFRSTRDGMSEFYVLDWESFALERLTYSMDGDDLSLFRWDADGHSAVISD